MTKDENIEEVMELVYGAIHSGVIYGSTEDGNKEAAYNKVREDESVIEAKLLELLNETHQAGYEADEAMSWNRGM